MCWVQSGNAKPPPSLGAKREASRRLVLSAQRGNEAQRDLCGPARSKRRSAPGRRARFTSAAVCGPWIAEGCCAEPRSETWAAVCRRGLRLARTRKRRRIGLFAGRAKRENCDALAAWARSAGPREALAAKCPTKWGLVSEAGKFRVTQPVAAPLATRRRVAKADRARGYCRRAGPGEASRPWALSLARCEARARACADSSLPKRNASTATRWVQGRARQCRGERGGEVSD